MHFYSKTAIDDALFIKVISLGKSSWVSRSSLITSRRKIYMIMTDYFRKKSTYDNSSIFNRISIKSLESSPILERKHSMNIFRKDDPRQPHSCLFSTSHISPIENLECNFGSRLLDFRWNHCGVYLTLELIDHSFWYNAFSSLLSYTV